MGAIPADARSRRRTELLLLILAIVITSIAYALVGLSLRPVLPSGVALYGGALAALALAAHLVTRRMAPGADPLLLPMAFLLNGIGLVMVRRIDYAESVGDGVQLAPLQTVWTVVGVAAFCLTLIVLRDHTVLDRYRYILGLLALIALLTPLLPLIGTDFGRGSRIWVRAFGFSLQPGEFAKLGLVAFFASYLAEKRPLLATATNRLGPFPVPPLRAFAPIARGVGDQPRGAGLRARPGAVAPGVRDLRGAAVHGDRAHRLRADRRRSLRAGGVRGLDGLRTRADPHRDLAGPVGGRRRAAGSSSRSRCSRWAPAASRAWAWARASPTSSPTW